MRCRNCHTVMMETDLACPCCHASVASATSAAPGPIAKSPSGLLMMLPIFGGAIGGLAYGLLVGPEGVSSGNARGGSGGSGGAIKWGLGLFLIIVGILFLPLAGFYFYETWNLARREPKVVTAAELRKTDGVKSSPGAWLAYTFEESKPTGLAVTRHRLGHGGDVKARCLLVRVDDKWLIASVASGFQGKRLVGRLVPADTATSQLLLEKLRKSEAKPPTLLPYEFNAVDGSASDQRVRYMGAGWLAFFGLLGLFPGLYLVRGKRHSAPSSTAPAAASVTPSFLPRVNG